MKIEIAAKMGQNYGRKRLLFVFAEKFFSIFNEADKHDYTRACKAGKEHHFEDAHGEYGKQHRNDCSLFSGRWSSDFLAVFGRRRAAARILKPPLAEIHTSPPTKRAHLQELTLSAAERRRELLPGLRPLVNVRGLSAPRGSLGHPPLLIH
jgi:hypothetical protein